MSIEIILKRLDEQIAHLQGELSRLRTLIGLIPGIQTQLDDLIRLRQVMGNPAFNLSKTDILALLREGLLQ